MLELEKIYQTKLWLAGLDEAGRGPLAGPVVGACALVEKQESSQWDELANFLKELGVMDSKKSTSLKRQKVLEKLGLTLQEGVQVLNLGSQSQYRLYISAQQISAVEIDEINILRAALKSMGQSFKKIVEQHPMLPTKGELWFDGNRCPEDLLSSRYQLQSVIKGDAKSVLIGLASFLAKEVRDELMRGLDQSYPGYNLSQHAGYPTLAHRNAIAQLGASPVHRKTFKGVREHL